MGHASHEISHKSHISFRTSLTYVGIPMVHTRDREPVAQVVKRWFDLQEVLGSNLTGVHSLVWLPKSCCCDLMKVETAVQILTDLV